MWFRDILETLLLCLVLFDPPFDSSDPYIKTVIGLPGDKVSINRDGVYINGID